MMWVELAIYIVIIVSLIHFSQYFLWLIFGLFAYRFWSLMLPYQALSKVIHFEKMSHYTITIVILAIVTYTLVMLCTQSIPFLRYVFLLTMAVYTLRVYSVSDVMFFKDYFVSHGMWSSEYWVNAVKNIFSISKNPNGILGIFKSIGQSIVNGLNSFAHYIKAL